MFTGHEGWGDTNAFDAVSEDEQQSPGLMPVGYIQGSVKYRPIRC